MQSCDSGCLLYLLTKRSTCSSVSHLVPVDFALRQSCLVKFLPAVMAFSLITPHLKPTYPLQPRPVFSLLSFRLISEWKHHLVVVFLFCEGEMGGSVIIRLLLL